MFSGNTKSQKDSKVLHATDNNFESEVIRAETPVLVDFWAPWCGPCRLLGPIIDELSVDLAGKVKVVKVNVDENPMISGSMRIQAIPTLAIFVAGKPVRTIAGVRSKQEILHTINETTSVGKG